MNTDKHRCRRAQYLCSSVFICGSYKKSLVARACSLPLASVFIGILLAANAVAAEKTVTAPHMAQTTPPSSPQASIKKTPPPPLKVLPESLSNDLQISRPPLLPEQALYQFLLSEIAGQRGRTELASQGMLDLAVRSRDARIARRATEMAFQAKQMGDARQALMLWLSLEPESQVARQALGALLGVDSGIDKTVATVNQWLADKSFEKKYAPTLFEQLPYLLLRFQDRQAMSTTMAEMALPYSQMAEANYAVGVLSLAANQRDAAKSSLDIALKLRPQFPQAAIAYARFLRDANTQSADVEAATYLENYLKRFPNDTEVRVAYGRLLVGMKSLLSAREAFRRAADERPTDPEMPYATGLIALQMEDWADAEKYFLETLKRDPRDKNPIYVNLALVAEGKKEFDAALNWYRQIGEGEYFVAAQLKLATDIAKRQGLAAARAFLREARRVQQVQEALQADDDTAEVSAQKRVQLVLAEAQLLRDNKAHRETVELLTEALANDPKSTDLRYDRAMAAEKIAQYKMMEDDLRTIIKIKPDHAHAYNALGYSFAERGIRLDEAYTLIQDAVKLAPNDAYIQDSLGWVQFKLGRNQEALATLEKAYTMKRDPEIAAHLGEVMFQMGKRAEALSLWQSALKDFPDNQALIGLVARYAK
jgi:tetratricopeptide (TPR) repeat protein